MNMTPVDANPKTTLATMMIDKPATAIPRESEESGRVPWPAM
jgi:hypothetical protein